MPPAKKNKLKGMRFKPSEVPSKQARKVAGMIPLSQTQIEQDIMHNKAGNQIDHAIVYNKEHVQSKGYRLLSGAGSMAVCPVSVDSPSTMKL